MSRRYGRNQKRAHRARIAELEARVTGLEWQVKERDGLLAYKQERLNEAARSLDAAVSILGDNHPAFPASELGMTLNSHQDTFRLPHRGFIQPFDASMDFQSMTMMLHQLDVMTVDSLREDFHNQTHWRVRYGDGRWGYAISPQTMRGLPERVIRQNMVEELAHLIARDLKGKSRRAA